MSDDEKNCGKSAVPADENFDGNAAVPARSENRFRPLWLAVAAIALVAAFLLQWKNGIDQAAIAQTDDGQFIRAKIEGDAFRIFSAKTHTPIPEAFLYGSDGEMLAKIVPAASDPALFRREKNDASTEEKLRGEKFLYIVIPSEKSDGKPVILLVKNPFRSARTPAQNQ